MNPTLLTKPYEVQSRVSADSFRVFLGAIGGSEATITNDNVSDLGQLCSEFEFSEFAQKVDEWRSACGAFDADVRRELRVLKTAMDDQQLRHKLEISNLEREVELLRQVSHGQREWQERESQAVRLAVEDVGRAKEQMRAEVGGLKQRIEVLEQENRRLSAANEMLKRDIGEVSDCCPKRKQDWTTLEREVAKLKEEMRTMMPKANSPTHPSPPTVKPAPDAPAASPPAKPVKVSPPPAPAKPPKPAQQFPPSVKKVKTKSIYTNEEVEIDVPDGIIAHLTRECGGNVHDHHVVDVTAGSFEKEDHGASPHSGVYNNNPYWPAKNAADLETDSRFGSAFRERTEDILHTRNNWICYDFKKRRIVPTHYTIRTRRGGPGGEHLKSWLVETSTDGKHWREVSREEDNYQLNGELFIATFAVAGGGECRFIRLVNIGRNHYRNDGLFISAWEIFGNLIE
jgi:regulator of replication initiation timing